jgi:hypothetical protein
VILMLVWNWYEIWEGLTSGSVTELVIVLVPLVWLGLKHVVRPAIERHAEILAHAKHQTMLAEETHYAAHHPGQLHPRVQARLERGEDHTPTLEGT